MNKNLLSAFCTGTILLTTSISSALEPTLDRIKNGTQIIDYVPDVSILPGSVLEYGKATSTDNSFGFYDNNIQKNQYYKVLLKPEKFSNSKDLVFTADNNGKIAVNLPNGKIQRYSYEYTGNSEYVGKYYESIVIGGGDIGFYGISIGGDDDWGDDWGDGDWEGDLEIGGSNIGGGAIDVGEDTDSIVADFINNRVDVNDDAELNTIFGGAIKNSEWVIGNISGDFADNYLNADFTYGGAIDNYGHIAEITGNFVGNYANATNESWGGSISNGNTLGNITGSFIGNYAKSANFSLGGAIANYFGAVGDIVGDFVGNYAESNDKSLGGAIANGLEYQSEIGNITGDFVSNYVKGAIAKGGAIMNMFSDIGHITGDFIGNYAEGADTVAGGAIYYQKGTFGPDDEIGWGDLFSLKNSTADYTGSIKSISGSFIDNHVKVTGTDGIGLGGAIYVQDDSLNFKADGVINRFSGNYVEYADGSKINNAIFVNNTVADTQLNLNFEIKNQGSFVFDDEIDGGFSDFSVPVKEEGYSYNINISGDAYNIDNSEANTIRFNDRVNNVYDFKIASVQMALGQNAVINIVHDYVASENPFLRLDVDAVNCKIGKINIAGNVDGTTSVIVNILKNKETAKENSIPFATALNHTLSEEDAQKSFDVYRVIGSPYMWEVNYNDIKKEWGLYSTNEENPFYEDDSSDVPVSPSKPVHSMEVSSEIIAYEAIAKSALAQTYGLVSNVSRNVSKADNNLWVDTTYNGLEIDAPVEIEAKVWGIEAGSDIQRDLHNKLGIFVSYRQGNYEMDGKGDKYFAKLGSELDIDSYLAGLYYRYDNNNWYAFATLYGGMQEAEINTDDGVSTDTDGIEFGGSAEVGYSYALNKTVYVTPSLGVFYTQVSYDDASDNYGKTVEYNDLKQVEIEAGLK
ncbi:MAG: autotransporter domain-containing protein, partial [Alphaproteobacteria bacterium]|nr:autotransporter domain-containing protein [Alphaproteobacteria bacterium]